ncbi:MAG: class I SAM-dependent methyltransferase [Chloroflexi bacterium]|nr:class I SAM-dependent methyltransferase [Chloroflexota bacterium]
MSELNVTENPSSEDFSFSAFSNLPFYRQINARLLDLAEIGSHRRIVDLGCGTGGVTKLILERLQSARDTVIYAVDHSASALKDAVAELGGRKDAVIRFIQSPVQNLMNAVTDDVDAVVYCNSIHYVPDKKTLLAQIREKLTPNGLLAINTSFYDGSHPPESEDFYRRWLMRSLRILKREYGMKPDSSMKVESRQHLTKEQYEELLVCSGFTIVRSEVSDIDVPESGWFHISGFRDWIEGVMPGVPLEVGKEALQKGLRQVFEERGLVTVPRRWLSISAARA